MCPEDLVIVAKSFYCYMRNFQCWVLIWFWTDVVTETNSVFCIDRCDGLWVLAHLGSSTRKRVSDVLTPSYLFLYFLGRLLLFHQPVWLGTAVRGTGASLTSHYPPFVPGAPLKNFHGSGPCNPGPPGSPPAQSESSHQAMLWSSWSAIHLYYPTFVLVRLASHLPVSAFLSTLEPDLASVFGFSKNPHCPESPPGAWHESSGMLIYNYRIKPDFFSLFSIFFKKSFIEFYSQFSFKWKLQTK